MSRELPDGKVILTYDEAVSRLTVHEDAPEDGGRRTVHTYVESSVALLGADWDEADVLTLLREADQREDERYRINETGPAAQAMRHGLCVFREDRGPVFIAARGPDS